MYKKIKCTIGMVRSAERIQTPHEITKFKIVRCIKNYFLENVSLFRFTIKCKMFIYFFEVTG